MKLGPAPVTRHRFELQARERRASTDPHIVTVAEEPDIVRLPNSGHPIRGRRGVATQIEGSERVWSGPISTSSLVVRTLIDAQRWPGPKDGDTPGQPQANVHHRYRDLVQAQVASAPLAQRIVDSRGFKHHEPAALEAIVLQPEPDLSFGLNTLLEDALTQAVHGIVARSSLRGTVSSWDFWQLAPSLRSR